MERTIRPSAVGKNYGKRSYAKPEFEGAAVIYSLVVSCQRHGHNAHDYLRDVLRRLPAMTTNDDLGPLLPSHWKPPAMAALSLTHLREIHRRKL